MRQWNNAKSVCSNKESSFRCILDFLKCTWTDLMDGCLLTRGTIFLCHFSNKLKTKWPSAPASTFEAIFINFHQFSFQSQNWKNFCGYFKTDWCAYWSPLRFLWIRGLLGVALDLSGGPLTELEMEPVAGTSRGIKSSILSRHSHSVWL
jgi:hypothetical protein